jgi:predicted ATP-grasp superfamily ATP-dependent carboligase
MRSSTDERTKRPILVFEGHTIGSLAVIRSLGGAGYPVTACSSHPDAIGFQSRFASRSCLHPPYESAGAFLEWLDREIASGAPQLIIPSEGFLLAARPRFERIRGLLPYPQDEGTVYRALSKWDLFAGFEGTALMEHLPPFRLMTSEDDLPDAGAQEALGYPIYVKVDAVHALKPAPGRVVACASYEELRRRVDELRPSYRRLLLQGHVSGVGVGAFLLRWQGRERAHFLHRRLHEVPHTGGASSFRESWWHDGVLEDARRRMEHLAWDGVGMFEYRWHPHTGAFYLMEFNARFWRSLHLALYAGVDFPRLLADAFFGFESEEPAPYRHVRCRLSFPADMDYVISCLRDPALSPARRLGPVLEFAWLTVAPGVRDDLAFPGDGRLYWTMLRRTLRQLLS